MIVEGKTRSLLQTERLMLNIMQRMSGIATITNEMAKEIAGDQNKIAGYQKDNS